MLLLDSGMSDELDTRQDLSSIQAQAAAHAWDHTGGAIFDPADNPHPRGSDEAREYYRAYLVACRDIAEHRAGLGKPPKPPDDALDTP